MTIRYHHIYIDSPDKNIPQKSKNCKKEYYILKTALHQKISENRVILSQVIKKDDENPIHCF